jgi:hypothetical protein
MFSSCYSPRILVAKRTPDIYRRNASEGLSMIAAMLIRKAGTGQSISKILLLGFVDRENQGCDQKHAWDNKRNYSSKPASRRTRADVIFALQAVGSPPNHAAGDYAGTFGIAQQQSPVANKVDQPRIAF